MAYQQKVWQRFNFIDCEDVLVKTWEIQWIY